MTKYGIEIKHLPTGTEITSDTCFTDKELDSLKSLLETCAAGKVTYLQMVKNGDYMYIPKDVLLQSTILLFKETV